jgi:DNA primase
MTAVDEIKQRVDIVDIISRYTSLKKAGSTYKGLCPFHEERTPSFVVFPNTGTWHCFGACSTGGDVFTFLMKKENLDFRETLELLARETGVELHPAEGDASHRQRNTIYKINSAAANYFQNILRQHSGANAARAYLERRQIDAETMERFQLGFALDGWDGLRNHLVAQGYSIEEQLAAGLIKHNQERNSVYDAFRGRVMIPIRDRQGRVIGFGGRVLGDGVPKYLNTAETPVFHKSHVVYGIDLAHRAISDEDQVVIVEGYMDVIAAHQHGFSNVVACMGTALTPDQLRQLQRYTKNFVLALDADAAGQQATIRGLNQARQALARVQKATMTGGRMRLTERLAANLSILSMPEGSDPDDVIRRDPAQWKRLIGEAKPLVDFYFQVVADQVDLTSAQGKATAVAELAPLIAELGDEIERQHYIQELSRLVQVDERTIAGRVDAAARTIKAGDRTQSSGHRRPETHRRPPPRAAGPPTMGSLAEPPPDEWDAPWGEEDDWRPEIDEAGPAPQTAAHRAPTPTQEDHLLAVLLQTPNLFVWLAQVATKVNIPPLGESDFGNAENREIFRTLNSFIMRDEAWDFEIFQDEIDEQLHGRLAWLTAYAAQLPPPGLMAQQEDAAKTMFRLRLQQLKAKGNQLKFLQDDAHRNGDREAMRSYDIINNQNLRDLFHLQMLLKRLREMVFDRERQD